MITETVRFDTSAISLASTTSIGPGCAGSNGTPNLRSEGLWIRNESVLTISSIGVSTGNIPFLVYGFSNAVWPNVGLLPLDLTTLGLAGCTAYTSAEGTIPLQNSQIGEVNHMLTVPALGALVGGPIYWQAIVLDPTAGNAFGAVVSNALETVIGSR